MRNNEFSTGQHRAIRRAEPSTPPVENSNPEGGPKGADGQGVCTLNYVVHWWLANAVLTADGVPRTGSVAARSLQHANRIRDVLLTEPGIYVLVEGLPS